MKIAMILVIVWFSYAAIALNQAERRLDRCQDSMAPHQSQGLFK